MAAAGDTIYHQFTTKSQGALADADATPTGTLVKNGADTVVTVTVTNVATGIYVAQFTIPAAYVAGDEVAVRIAATIGGVSTATIVWQESLSSGATASAASADYETNLTTTRNQVSARLVEITANPKPSYLVHGQMVQWSAYHSMLMDTLERLNKLIAEGDGTPWEETMELYLP